MSIKNKAEVVERRMTGITYFLGVGGATFGMVTSMMDWRLMGSEAIIWFVGALVYFYLWIEVSAARKRMRIERMFRDSMKRIGSTPWRNEPQGPNFLRDVQ